MHVLVLYYCNCHHRAYEYKAVPGYLVPDTVTKHPRTNLVLIISLDSDLGFGLAQVRGVYRYVVTAVVGGRGGGGDGVCDAVGVGFGVGVGVAVVLVLASVLALVFVFKY